MSINWRAKRVGDMLKPADATNRLAWPTAPAMQQQPQVIYVQAPAPTKYVSRRRTHLAGNTFHLVMSAVTCGLWVPVWIFVAITRRHTTITRARP
jgi:hypothetical protein